MSIEIARQIVADLRERDIGIELEDGEIRLDFPYRMGEELRQVDRYQVVMRYDEIVQVLEGERDDA